MQFHLHVHFGGHDCPDCPHEAREHVKLGDGKILRLILTYGPLIAQLFGLKIPPLPTEGEPVKEPAVG